MSPSLAGLHDIESAAIAPPDTWLLDTIALSENPLPRDYPAHLHTIVRANWGYGSTGTLPKPDGYAQYAARLSAYVRGSRNCRRWQIGNEPNLSREWPDNQPVFPWFYAACYKMARTAIHAIPGHEQDEVLIAAPGPWNAELKYPGNTNGDWIKYFEDVINTCYDEIDGFSIHSYTHGYSVPLVTSSARMQAPFSSRHYEFRAYRDYLEAIPEALTHLPVYLTEANGNGPWQAVGLMPAMLNEIDNWNKTARTKVQCVIFYRYPRFDEYAIEGKPDVLAEYKQAIQAGYSSPSGSKNTAMPQTTLLPHVSNQAAPELLPREWDARLTQRGVTVETPPLHPGQQYWRVSKARWFSEAEAGGRHHIYVEAIDRNGQPIDAVPFEVFWPGDHAFGKTKAGRGFDAGNFPMSPSRNEFGVGIDTEYPTETLRGIGMGAETPGGFNAGIHTSTLVTFELATVPQASAPPHTEPTGTMYVTAPSGLNLRAAPEGDVLIAIPFAAPVTITGTATINGWLRASYAGHTGWLSSAYVSPDKPVPVGEAPPQHTVHLPNIVGEPPEVDTPPPPIDTWQRSRAFIAKWEGEYQNVHNDAGNWTGCAVGVGELKGTKYGISACSYPHLDIKNLTMAQADAIYFTDYWQRSAADQMPWPLCLLVLDTAVLHGVGTAQTWLKEVGPNPYHFAAKRLRVYTKMSNWDFWGKAWCLRVSDLLEEMAK